MPDTNSPTFKVRRIDHWPDEFLVGIAGMTWEESGAYRTICDLIYSSGRNISSDDPRLVVFGGGHRNRVNSMIIRLESLGKISTKPVETSEKSAGKVLEISVTRCTKELESARNRMENASDTSKINGLNGHARGHTHAHARDSNLQPSTSNLQPPTRARHAREEGASKNGKWKKAQPPLDHVPGHFDGCQCPGCERLAELAAEFESANAPAAQDASERASQSQLHREEPATKSEATPDRP